MIRLGLPAAAALLLGTASTQPLAQVSQQGGQLAPFTLTVLGAKSSGTLPLAQVRDGDGCKGGDKPPQLSWAAAPPGGKSFALTMFDETANFWHWALYDLSADVRSYDSGKAPSGTRTGRNDFGHPGYGGACPPPGKPHRYRFTVWALPEGTLPVAAGAADKEIGGYLQAHALGHANLTFSYGR